MHDSYVENHEGSYRITGSRVSLDSVVVAFLHGLSPETIVAECFPTLTLEQVYGAITYYLAHREQVNAYLKQAEAETDELRQRTRDADPEFSRRWAAARRQLPTPHA